MTNNKKVQGEQEVFAYRVGKKLICPACHELAVKILAVHEIEPTPSKTVKRGDVQGFICDRCGVIRGDYKISSVQELRDLQEKLHLTDVVKVIAATPRKSSDLLPLIDLEDELNRCISKVALLNDCFCPHRHEDELFSPKGLAGFRFILTGIEDDLNRIADGMRAEARLEWAERQPTSVEGSTLEAIGTARAMGKI